MKKILNPKALAITTIITSIIGIVLSIILSVQNTPLYLHLSQVVAVIVNFVLYGNLYITIYLFIILTKKQKNVRLLNTILFVSLVIATILYIIRQLFYIKDIYTIANTLNNTALLINIFNTISSILFFVLETIMVFGILKKKKMSYKIFMLVLVGIILTDLIFTTISIFAYNNSLLNVFANIVGIVKSSSFVLFIYLYGKSVNERSTSNE